MKNRQKLFSIKTIFRLLIFCSFLLVFIFSWQEFSDISLSRKINAEKISSFFTAIGSLLTATTVFLLYKQIEEQIEDRKATSKPELYPEDQFFTLVADENLPMLSRDQKNEVVAGLISIHNIGFGAAKEIKIQWHFNHDILFTLIRSELLEFYSSREHTNTYSFVRPNNQIEIPLPIMYIASLAYFKEGWTQMIWEELFLEISFKDIHDIEHNSKFFKVLVNVGANFASFRFSCVDAIELSKASTMKSPFFIPKLQT